MKRPSAEWYRRHILEGPEEPDGCPSCGVIAGCCDNYPNCPGGQMTTQVKVIHEGGNHRVIIKKFYNANASGEPADHAVLSVKGDEFVGYVHGSSSFTVVEAADEATG